MPESWHDSFHDFRLGHTISQPNSGFMAYISEAPMRISTEDPCALTELVKAGGAWGAAPQPRGGGGLGGTPPSR